MNELRQGVSEYHDTSKHHDTNGFDGKQVPAMTREAVEVAATPETSTASGEPAERRAEIDWRD